MIHKLKARFMKHDNKPLYIGLFLTAMSTLMLEILLSRILSVVLWYHYAFVIISIALFGMSAGALYVYLHPDRFKKEDIMSRLGNIALAYSVALVALVLAFAIPVTEFEFFAGMFTSSMSLVFVYLIGVVPFTLGGIVITAVLTQHADTGRLYAADLIGAGLGCWALLFVLERVDALSAGIFTGIIAAAGAIAFMQARDATDKARKLGYGVLGLFTLLFVVNLALGDDGKPFLRIPDTKGLHSDVVVYEKWNSYSRLAVTEASNNGHNFGWGMSPTFVTKPSVEMMNLTIDAGAGTVFTRYEGDLDAVDYLKLDITNMVHYVRPNSDVLVIGVGGGRDILSSLVFDQASVTGVEVNDDILKLLTGVYGDFTGHLDTIPNVAFVSGEGRDYITREDARYDILQVSLIDTWAATAAGALTMTENTLYTTEGWELFLSHLNEGGVLSFSRWFFHDRPGEIYRMLSLSYESLHNLGAENPRDHVIVINTPFVETRPSGVGTLLISDEPFSESDIATVRERAEELGFEIFIDPFDSQDEKATALLGGQIPADLTLNVEAPTDDQPYFFQMVSLKQLIDGITVSWYDANTFNNSAIHSVLFLFGIVIIMTGLFIIFPLLRVTGWKELKGKYRYVAYFGGIGLGFMMVEIALLQKLTVFLGHPVFSLSVVLFSLLIASGLGSYMTRNVTEEQARQVIGKRMVVLILLFGLYLLASGAIFSAFVGYSVFTKIVVAIITIVPMGIFMGMAFPLGMAAVKHDQKLTPWLWGVNGATSVLASVAAVFFSLLFGITVTFLIGVGAYVMVLLTSRTFER